MDFRSGKVDRNHTRKGDQNESSIALVDKDSHTDWSENDWADWWLVINEFCDACPSDAWSCSETSLESNTEKVLHHETCELPATRAFHNSKWNASVWSKSIAIIPSISKTPIAHSAFKEAFKCWTYEACHCPSLQTDSHTSKLCHLPFLFWIFNSFFFNFLKHYNNNKIFVPF